MSTSFAKDAFFSRLHQQGLRVTFDDVRLETNYSNIVPSKADTSSLFSRRVPLRIPLVSAAMDTVTEYHMALAMAMNGGIGVIHRALKPDEQARQVTKTKHYLNAKIKRPICISQSDTIGNVLSMRQAKDYSFHSFPVIDENQRLVGIITKNDFDFCALDTSTKIFDAMSKKPLCAPATTTAWEAYNLMLSEKKKALPLVDENNLVVGMYIISDLQRILLNENAPQQNTDTNGQLRVAAAIGVDDYDRAALLRDANVDALVLQSAHSDTESMLRTLRTLKQDRSFSSIDIVIGNVSRANSALRMAEAGADGIIVGQGGGSICTTRIVAGIGCPQVSAIDQCERILRNLDIPLCSDGGIKNSGDIVIALAAGATSCMVGNLLAGTDETPGSIFNQGRPYKSYVGMGSESRLRENAVNRQRYNLSDTGKSDFAPEGVEAIVPYKGPVELILRRAIGGLRAGMGYLGAPTIEVLRQTAEFFMITSSGLRESHPHDITPASESTHIINKG